MRLAAAKLCFSIIPVILLNPPPTCQTWFTVSAFSGTLTVAKMVKALVYSALTFQTSKESFPGMMEL
ncbi:hypothetical protein M0R45_020760 [Rubus argutus]|uniref:Uncharacterized protein n=1 Tax=Rubus argutus TaxID=59490 RepID=A0AAW1XA71_RUBAR